MSKDLLKSISVIIGTLIGAGFASGKEIYIFFIQYGQYGIIGIALTIIITIYLIDAVIKITNQKNIKNNSDFINTISNNSNIKITLKNTINSFLLISFFIMIAGFSAYFKQEFNIPIYISSSLIAIIIYYTFMNNIDGIVKTCSIIVPILLVIMSYIIIKKLFIQHNFYQIERTIIPSIKLLIYSCISGILYASYNSIILIPIVISINKYIKNPKSKNKLLILTTIIITFLILGVCNILMDIDYNIKNMELPILQTLKQNKIDGLIYSVVIVVAIFTSALSSGYGILDNVKNKTAYKKLTATLCILSIPISYIGFGNLVSILYPLFGFIGTIQIILIIKAKKKIMK